CDLHGTDVPRDDVCHPTRRRISQFLSPARTTIEPVPRNEIISRPPAGFSSSARTARMVNLAPQVPPSANGNESKTFREKLFGARCAAEYNSIVESFSTECTAAEASFSDAKANVSVG